MWTRRRRLLLIAGALGASGCSGVIDSLGAETAIGAPDVVAVDSRATGVTIPPRQRPTISAPDTTEPTGEPVAQTEGERPTTTEPAIQVTVADDGRAEPAVLHDAACVVTVAPGDSLELIAARFDDETVDVAALVDENGLTGENLEPGTRLDVCVDNALDDITGAQRTERDHAKVADGERLTVEAQQRHLNELFEGYGIRELLVDGVSGPVTRQRLCAARLAFGLPVSTADMLPDSEEAAVIMSADTLPIPYTSAILSDRWILIDRTCQIMFVGSGTERLEFVFPTSTGHSGFETRTQNRTAAFRYNPARGNGGWHNSTTYPVAADNPLNGNMYQPLYFDRGQAIHGANNVPRSPASKGCARLRVHHQDLLVDWLGLGDVGRPTNDRGRLNVTVNVQGWWG